MNFAETVMNTPNKLTENGAAAHDSTGKAILDLFAQIGALRPRTEKEIEAKFADAYNANPLIATKMLFYCGNIRGGLGERRTFRICLRWLAINYPHTVIVNMANIYHFNRWDSMFVLIDTPVVSGGIEQNLFFPVAQIALLTQKIFQPVKISGKT
jgi:hypothetical protein